MMWTPGASGNKPSLRSLGTLTLQGGFGLLLEVLARGLRLEVMVILAHVTDAQLPEQIVVRDVVPALRVVD